MVRVGYAVGMYSGLSPQHLQSVNRSVGDYNGGAGTPGTGKAGEPGWTPKSDRPLAGNVTAMLRRCRDLPRPRIGVDLTWLAGLISAIAVTIVGAVWAMLPVCASYTAGGTSGATGPAHPPDPARSRRARGDGTPPVDPTGIDPQRQRSLKEPGHARTPLKLRRTFATAERPPNTSTSNRANPSSKTERNAGDARHKGTKHEP